MCVIHQNILSYFAAESEIELDRYRWKLLLLIDKIGGKIKLSFTELIFVKLSDGQCGFNINEIQDSVKN